MKTIENTGCKFGVVVLLIVITLTSCARKLNFGTSAVVPAAEGGVKIKTDANNNNAIAVFVKHLALSNRLTPPKQTYVVWMITSENVTKNIGQLNSSSGFLSKAYKASLNTVTAFKPVSFFITAEDDPTVTHPSAPVIMKTDN